MIPLTSTKVDKKPTKVRIALTLIAAIAASGCQASRTQVTNAPSGAWISAAQAELEYKDEAQKLTLAPGWEWPQAMQYKSLAPDGKKNNYGVNTGRVDAAWYWHCTWARNYFDATSASEREANLQQVLRLRDSAFYRYGLVAEDKVERNRVLDLATSGDTKALRDIIEGNCPHRNHLAPLAP